MEKSDKRLHLSRDTIRVLSGEEEAQVHGGRPPNIGYTVTLTTPLPNGGCASAGVTCLPAATCGNTCPATCMAGPTC